EFGVNLLICDQEQAEQGVSNRIRTNASNDRCAIDAEKNSVDEHSVRALSDRHAQALLTIFGRDNAIASSLDRSAEFFAVRLAVVNDQYHRNERISIGSASARFRE